MSSRTVVPSRFPVRARYLLFIGATVLALAPYAWAISGFGNSAVGGVSINAVGVVGLPTAEAKSLYLRELRKVIKTPTGKLATPAKLRMVSMRGLVQAIDDAIKNNFGQLPDEVKYLGGLQRIQYLFVYPEKGDIVLAGPGEGWEIDANGNVVGQTTGHPVLHLDDFLVALRSVGEAEFGEISCSIDPTKEGWDRLAAVLKRQRGNRVDPPVLKAAAREAFGNQVVSIKGVPATSRFARMMLAADFHMKLLAMEIEGRPVDFPSYIDMIKNPREATNASPRWWLACNYQPMATSEDRLAWELRGPGVKAMTEDEIRAEDGTVRQTGRTSPAAQKWAALMTERYGDLCGKVAAFGEMRNLMDMSVIAALLKKEGLWEKADIVNASLLHDPGSDLKVDVWNAPKAVPAQVSIARVKRSLIVTASGGVQVDSWQVASSVEVAPEVGDVRKRATPNGDSLWWQ
ncbi:MAG: DUF1598 domain-containing protein [Pirellulaceae bacterium]